MAQEKDYKHKLFLDKAGAVKKMLYHDNAIAAVLGISSGAFSKLKKPNDQRRDDTYDKHISILEAWLKKKMVLEEKEVEYKTKDSDMRDLKDEMAKLNKKADQIIALLKKKN